MKETRVAHRYAHALFNVAVKRDLVDIVASELSQLGTFIDKDRRLTLFLEAPQVPTENKTNLIDKLFANRISPPLLSFLHLLINKGRIEYLAEIADEFDKLVEQHRGIVKARVITAVPLDDNYRGRLKTKLEKISGKQIEIIHKIDNGIIGGIIIQLNDRIIDYSVRHKLAMLRHDLLAAKVY